ncbi:MAG TPA: histidine kinase [Terriglobales bacterium]|nr:histidine kinase [Terriglobales bacterium]
MNRTSFQPTGQGPTRPWPAIILVWALVVLFFAAQWYGYDVSQGQAERFIFYVWACAYMLAVLTPSAVWLAWRFPITASTWRQRLPLHIIASLLLTGAQVLLQAGFSWMRHRDEMTWSFALRHYFTNVEQISFLTYWLLVAAALFYRTREDARESTLRSAKLESQLSAARLEMLSRQLHPHFLFNTLQAATTLVHYDPDRAEEILLRLSELLRVSLHESEQQEITLARELEILESYIAIQSCRFGDRLQFQLSIDQEALGCAVPSLLLQPLVENAVRHGIGVHKESDTITLRARRRDNLLLISISNQTSLLNRPAEELFGRGVGLSTTRNRLEQLYGTEGTSFSLYNLKPKGVCTKITIPFRIAPVRHDAPAAEVAR